MTSTFVSLDKACDLLHISLRHFRRRYLETGLLKAHWFGASKRRKIMFVATDIQRLVDSEEKAK